jgi:hypothetical protein
LLGTSEKLLQVSYQTCTEIGDGLGTTSQNQKTKFVSYNNNKQIKHVFRPLEGNV